MSTANRTPALSTDELSWVVGDGAIRTPEIEGGRHEIEIHGYVCREISDEAMDRHLARGRAIETSIGALPDLLAALRQLDNGYKYCTEVCNIARGAIAKAEGREWPLSPAQRIGKSEGRA